MTPAELCRELEVPYTRIHVPVYQIVLEERKERTLLLRQAAAGQPEHSADGAGIHKIALGHHYDDAIETLLMNLLFEGRIGCFQPVTYLDRYGHHPDPPTAVLPGVMIRRTVERPAGGPQPCSANGSTNDRR